MATVTYRPKAGESPQVDSVSRARLDALDDDAIHAAAESDPDNPPLDACELNRVALARLVRDTRRQLGLSQRAFAERYRIGHARLRDIEGGRAHDIDPALAAYLTVIKHAPRTVGEALDMGDEPA